MSDTFWTGDQADKLYLTSGQFSSTLKDSEYVGGIGVTYPSVSFDGTDCPWSADTSDKLFLQSGAFTSTVKTSQSISAIDQFPRGCSSDDTNTPWTGGQAAKLYLTSGKFSSTLKTSYATGGIDTIPFNLSWDGTNTPWCGFQADKLYLQSGQFSSTLKTSVAVAVATDPSGISWDGTNTPWLAYSTDKLYLQSGQFTSTIKTSLSVGAVDTTPLGIEDGDFAARTGAGVTINIDGSAEGNAHTSASIAVNFSVTADALGEAFTQALNGQVFIDGTAEGNAFTSADANLIVTTNGSAEGTATTSASATVTLGLSGTASCTATTSCEARKLTVSSAEGNAYTTGSISVTLPAINPARAGDLVDIGNSSVFKLTVNGDLIDFSAPVGTYGGFNMGDLDISYNGKDLTFEEFTFIGSATYAPEQDVTLDIDFGDGVLRRLFTGKIKQRDHEGRNNREAVRYQAVDVLQLSDDLTAVGSTGYPQITYTVASTVTTVSSAYGTYVGSFYANGSVPVYGGGTKKIKDAITELFAFNATQLSSVGITTNIGAPGLEQFTAELPETVALDGMGFGSALKRLAEYQTGVKVLYDEQQQAWTFPNILTSQTVIIDISSTNIPQLPYSMDTTDRFTAVRLYADLADDTGLDDLFKDKSDIASLGGPLGFGRLERTEVSLSPKWLREREANWSMFTALYGNPATLEGQDYFVYRRYSIPAGTEPPAFGLEARAFAKYNYWGEVFWAPLHGYINFKRGEFIADYPAISFGNVWHPGNAFPASEVKLAYVPGTVQYTPASSITDAGTPVYGTVATTFVSKSDFADQLRYPATGYEGTAYDFFGIEREYHMIVDPTEVTTLKAKALLDVRKDVVVSADIPIEGDPILQLMTLNVKARVQHQVRSTGIESLTPFVTQYSYRFGRRGESTVSLSTDISGLIRG